ncbi:MAG: hypothetical protein V4804_00840 [Pseudomonadota bacterium]|jgi:predicted negative regulator of RcsB-dependent stress response
MNRNVLYLLLGVAIAVAGFLGWQLYEENRQPDGIEIDIGEDGLTIESN